MMSTLSASLTLYVLYVGLNTVMAAASKHTLDNRSKIIWNNKSAIFVMPRFSAYKIAGLAISTPSILYCAARRKSIGFPSKTTLGLTTITADILLTHLSVPLAIYNVVKYHSERKRNSA